VDEPEFEARSEMVPSPNPFRLSSLGHSQRLSRGFFPRGGGGLRRPERDVDPSFLSSAEVEAELRYTCTPLLCLRVVDIDDSASVYEKEVKLTLVISAEVLTSDVLEACDVVDNRET
jgi:hypothetical protein